MFHGTLFKQVSDRIVQRLLKDKDTFNMTIYQSDETRTIADLLRWNIADAAEAPFIRIGRLLLAVDQTGAEAWQPLINSLRDNYGARNFMLYSGRHGALEGCFQDNGMVPAGVAASRFYDDDVGESNRFAPLAQVDIQVIDTGHLPKLLYKQRVLTDTALGNWVIVSWCHSIASMCTVPNNAAPNFGKGGVLWVSAMNMARRRVIDIVNEDYAWLPRY